MKKLFGGLNLTWPKLIVSSIILGISVGLLNSVPLLKDTTITDIATYFDFWILCGIIIIMNSKSNKDSALKCFIFFLISQPLIYLAEVPFNPLGWQLFGYYKYWFIWTIFCIPMGYLGYYLKRDKWYSVLLLLGVLFLSMVNIGLPIKGLVYAFPHHLIYILIIFLASITYPLAIFNNKKNKYISLSIIVIALLVISFITLTSKTGYETTLPCSNDKFKYDDTYKVSLEDSDMGDVNITYMDTLKDYCVHANFKKAGDTKLVFESPDGVKKEFKLTVGESTYRIIEE